MEFKLTEVEHNKLDAFLGGVLDEYKSGAYTKTEAVGALAHVFTVAAEGNIGELSSWLENPGLSRIWKADTPANRPKS